jgi:hypothetical protein
MNLGLKTLTINEAGFKNYGTVMKAISPLSFTSHNVTIDTVDIIGAYVFLVACDPKKDVITGEVLINNLKLDGDRKEKWN